MGSFSLPPKIDDSKLPLHVEPTNESLQLFIIQSLKSILKTVGHEARRKSNELPTEMAACKSSEKATLCKQLENSGLAVRIAPLERESCTVSVGFTSQAVVSNTNVHRISATGHACAADVHQRSEIYVYKTSAVGTCIVHWDCRWFPSTSCKLQWHKQ